MPINAAKFADLHALITRKNLQIKGALNAMRSVVAALTLAAAARGFAPTPRAPLAMRPDAFSPAASQLRCKVEEVSFGASFTEAFNDWVEQSRSIRCAAPPLSAR